MSSFEPCTAESSGSDDPFCVVAFISERIDTTEEKKKKADSEFYSLYPASSHLD